MFFFIYSEVFAREVFSGKEEKNSQNDWSWIGTFVSKTRTEQLSKVLVESVFGANVKKTGQGRKVEISHELVKST